MDPCRSRRLGGFPALFVTLHTGAEKLCVTLLFCAKCKRKCVTEGIACPSIPSPKKNGPKAIDGNVAGIQNSTVQVWGGNGEERDRKDRPPRLADRIDNNGGPYSPLFFCLKSGLWIRPLPILRSAFLSATCAALAVCPTSGGEPRSRALRPFPVSDPWRISPCGNSASLARLTR